VSVHVILFVALICIMHDQFHGLLKIVIMSGHIGNVSCQCAGLMSRDKRPMYAGKNVHMSFLHYK